MEGEGLTTGGTPGEGGGGYGRGEGAGLRGRAWEIPGRGGGPTSIPIDPSPLRAVAGRTDYGSYSGPPFLGGQPRPTIPPRPAPLPPGGKGAVPTRLWRDLEPAGPPGSMRREDDFRCVNVK